MLSQEEFMDLCALKRQGLSNREIAAQLGYHPATVAKWLRAGGPPGHAPGCGVTTTTTSASVGWFS